MILRKFELGDAGVDDLLRLEDDVFTWVGETAAGSEVTLHLASLLRRILHQHQFINILVHTAVEVVGHGVNCWWLWLAILVTVAEDRDLNFSPLAQSTNSQLRLFSFTWAGLSNPDLIWVAIKVKQFALIGSQVLLSFLWMFQTWSQRTDRNQDETRSFKKTRDSRRCKSKWCSFLEVCSKYLVRVEIMFWWNWACHPDNSWVMWTYQPKYQAAQNIGKRRNYI